jgi:integrative and conjugative element protein (TIGR02256 family)
MLLDHVRHAPAETGGVVMGYWVSDREVVITAATSAGSQATHREDGYEPDVDHDQREIARIYQESGRLHTYLGDWHTHPDSAPGLSRRDRNTLRAIATDAGARTPEPLMVIIGSSVDGLTLAVWCRRVGARRTAWLRLKLFDYADR